MLLSKNHEQTILEISQGDYVHATADAFLIDRQARELSRHNLRFDRDFLRRYFMAFGEKHNPGGVHERYRTLGAFFQWLEKEEITSPDWKNPMLKVNALRTIRFSPFALEIELTAF